MLISQRSAAFLTALAVMRLALYAQTPPDKIRAYKDGDQVCVRSHFSASQDVVVVMGKGLNRQVNFSETLLIPSSTPGGEMTPPSAKVIHVCGDDTAPWILNDTYLGANHGLAMGQNVVADGYRFSTRDTGSLWLDAATNQYCVMNVLSPSNVWLLSENQSRTEIWKFRSALIGDTLRNAAGGQTCRLVQKETVQLRPVVRINRVQYLKDGKTPLPERETALCDFLEIREESDLIDPAALLASVKARPGQAANFTSRELAALLSDTITYRLGAAGSCVVDYRSNVRRAFKMGYMGFIQSGPLNKAVFDHYTYYVPKSLPFEKGSTTYDFRAGQDFMPAPPVPLYFRASERNVADPLNLPDRFIQIAGRSVNGQVIPEVGYALGYSPTVSVTKREERAGNTDTALFIYTSGKSYPHALDQKAGIVPAGKEFHCVAYRQYFDPAAYPRARAVYYHREGEFHMVYIDYLKQVPLDIIKLPDFLVGKKIEVIESSIDVSLPAAVPAEGLRLSVNQPYAYLVLKLR